jgi:hypothetical protein
MARKAIMAGGTEAERPSVKGGPVPKAGAQIFLFQNYA